VSLGSRSAALERLAASQDDPFDLLIVGGGITGAGAALDAASRGLSVALVERNDFASGTSSKSSKLVHGGLRYLEQRDFGLVREASAERGLLSRLAPHLVTPIPFVIPVSRRSVRAKFGVGLWTYDALASFRNLRLHRYVDRDETERLVPPLPTGKLRGGFVFYDSKTDDVRLVMEVLVTARRHGATVVNHAPVVNLEGSEAGCEIVVEDAVGGTRLTVKATRVLVAAGVWGDEVERLADRAAAARLRPSKGIHLVFSRDAIELSDAAAFIPDAAHRRMLFVVPWLDSVLVGTTDTPFEGDLDAPRVEAEDRSYVLDAVNAAFGTALDERDVAGAFAGLRPLVAGKAGETADLSRRHSVYEIATGIVGITGGKLTTYRRMAKDAVDRAVEGLDHSGRSKTEWIRLGVTNLATLELMVQRRARRLGISETRASNLVRSYGNQALALLDIVEQEGLASPLVPESLPLAAEAVYCARHEMATELSDLLARRTRLALTDRAAGIGAGSVAADLMGSELGWRSRERDRQMNAHRTEVERERGLPLGESERPRPGATSGAGAG
jgi:glycerol-3-phosphate dehydrogenase